MSPRPAILFDLGNTLAEYYHRDEFRPILERCVAAALDALRRQGIPTVEPSLALDRALAQNSESPDHRFRPMAGRLTRVFGLSDRHDVAESLSVPFLGPIFEVGRLYDDALTVLRALRTAGYSTGIVSNAPWGSPPELWRQELARLGLAAEVDCVVMCGDVGWRKPAPQIFEYAADRVGAEPPDCIFVGDDTEWDVQGAAAVGMRPVLVDRADRHRGYQGTRIRRLEELMRILG